jgi:hypothetical protein
VSEKDIDLKAATRQLSWQRGYSTRIDVPLRVYVDRSVNSSGFEEFTDLDMLAVHITAEGRVGLSIYDCKTSASRSTERAFWLRGVADLFDADMAWLVREEKVTNAARQLAARLRIGMMNRGDLDLQLKIDRHVAIPTHSAYQRLFDPTEILQQREKMGGGDRRLGALRDYLRYGYWIEEPWNALSQLVTQLAEAGRHLNSRHPVHIALLFDSAWLYLLALARASEYVRLTYSNNPELALPEYLLGGQSEIRAKQRAASVFQNLSGTTRDDLLPPYYQNLLELFGRLFVRPSTFTTAMQYCEVLVGVLCAGKRTPLETAAGADYDVVTAKLLVDTINFLVGAAGLGPTFRQVARELALPAPPPAPAAQTPSALIPSDQTLDIDITADTAPPPSQATPAKEVEQPRDTK